MSRRHLRPNIVARVLDAIVLTLSPEAGVRRMALRNRALRAQAGRHEAARATRVSLPMGAGSADSDLLHDLPTLRMKSRALVRDDAHAAAALEVKVDNVVGDGIRVRPAVTSKGTGLTTEQAQQWNDAVGSLWSSYCESIDWQGRLDWDGMTRLVFRSWMLDGDSFAKRVLDGGRVSQWETIDADRVVDVYGAARQETRGGVQFDGSGRIVGYHVQRAHPDDDAAAAVVTDFVPAADMAHVVNIARPGQTRGAPMLTPALGLFEHLHDYLESEIIAARATAKVAMFIKQNPNAQSDPDLQLDSSPDDDGSGERSWIQTLEAGTVRYLEEGEEIQPFLPNRPGTTFDPFVQRVLKAISGALRLPYQMIVKDFSGMTYSSARVALVEARRAFANDQRLLIARWCRPVWRTFVREQVAAGALPFAREFAVNPEPFLAAQFIPQAWGWIDPVKEVQAAQQAMWNNLSTPQLEASRSGLDVMDVLEERARFFVAARDLEAQHGLPPGTLTSERAERVESSQPNGSVATPQDQPAQDGDDQADDSEDNTA